MASARDSANAHGVARHRLALAVVSLTLLLLPALATRAEAASVGLGTADSFSVLGGSTVTNTGPSILTGDLGVSPGTAITGFPPGTVSGTTHYNDGVAGQAQADLTTAYNDAAGRSSTATVLADLAGRTLTPGVYTAATSLGLSGDLTLDGQGDPSAVFVFQAGSTLTTASGSHVLLIGGAQACNVFWQVGDAATIGPATAFTGNILALTSISLTNGATLDGRALARNGAVTLDTNTVTRSTCNTTPATPPGTTPPGTTPPGTTTPDTTDTVDTPGGTGDGGSDGTGDGSDGTGGGSDGTGGGDTDRAGSPSRVTTGPASLVGRDHARLKGSVRSDAGIRYFFEFWSSKGKPRRTATERLRPSAKATFVNARVRSLRPGTKYHYRLVGVGRGGKKVFGRERTFRTRPRQARPSQGSPARPPRTQGGFTG